MAGKALLQTSSAADSSLDEIRFGLRIRLSIASISISEESLQLRVIAPQQAVRTQCVAEGNMATQFLRALN
jgi:hypothetical protein